MCFSVSLFSYHISAFLLFFKYLHYHLLNCNLTISFSIFPTILKSFNSFFIFPRIDHCAYSNEQMSEMSGKSLTFVPTLRQEN